MMNDASMQIELHFIHPTAFRSHHYLKMIINNAIPFVSRRKARAADAPAIPGPNLVTAAFDSEGTVTLTFDQPIDLSQFNGSAIVVVDGFQTQKIFVGTQQYYSGSDNQIQVYLNETGPCDEGDTVLNATGESGIRSAATGGYWSGVSGWVI